jgi:hypothetical protein
VGYSFGGEEYILWADGEIHPYFSNLIES